MIAFEYLYNRRVPLIYVAPAVCEYDFSGTGEPSIYLAPIYTVGAPTGLAFGGVGGFNLSWGAVPGALCYSVYKALDVNAPFGDYTIVAECLAGTNYQVNEENFYRVEVITEDGTSDLSDPANPGVTPPPTPGEPPPPPWTPPPPPPTVLCGDGTPGVPASLLRDLDTPELAAEVNCDGTVVARSDFTAKDGMYQAQWISGSVWADCTLAPQSIPLTESFIRETWIEYPSGVYQVSLGQQFGCQIPVAPPVCTPPVETQVVAAWPDGIMEQTPEFVILPANPWVDQTLTYAVPITPNGGVHPAKCQSGGPVVMRLLRTMEFIPQPDALAIDDFETIKWSLFGNPLPSAASQWNGIINDNKVVIETGVQYVEFNNGQFVGDMAVVWVEVRCLPSSKWTLNILGQAGGVGPYIVIFYGEKRYGETGIGDYGKVSGISEELCVTLV